MALLTRTLGTITLCAVALWPVAVPAQERGDWGDSELSWAVIAAAGPTVVPKSSRYPVFHAAGMAHLAVRMGVPFGDSPESRFKLLVEAVPVMVFSELDSETFGAGIDVLVRYRLGRGAWSPAVVGGVGMQYTLDRTPTGVAHWNFRPQVGLLVQHRIGDRAALEIGYRFHHFSNAGLARDNPGANTQLISIGVEAW